MGKIYPELTEEKIEQIKTHPFYKDEYSYIIKEADLLLNEPIPHISYTEYIRFDADGDRTAFERKYFTRRRRLLFLAFASITQKEEKYIKALEEIIWEISNEFSWELPAHIANLTESRMISDTPIKRQITKSDLFACETALDLAAIRYICAPYLSELIKDIIKYEIENRIFYSFENFTQKWTDSTNNWAAVCAGSVGMAYMLLSPEKFESVKEKIYHTMDSYRAGFKSDYCCIEGVAYWAYGFGFYTAFSQMLYEFTDGKENWFDLEFTKQVALFYPRMRIMKTNTITFSDASTTECTYPLAYCALHKRHYKDDYKLLPIEFGKGHFFDGCARWPLFIGYFLWSDPDNMESEDAQNPYILYPETGWYIRNASEFSLVAKCGTNHESHNHNDIGSFIFYADDKRILDDIGSGIYTKQYFIPEFRYTYFQCSSESHNVPVIGGKFQIAGEDVEGKIVSASEDEFCVDVTKAYDCETLESFIRNLHIEKDGVTITDNFRFTADTSVEESFITKFKPEIGSGEIKIDSCKMIFDESVFSASLKEVPTHSHTSTIDSAPEIAYLIKLKAIKDEKEASYTIKIRK